MSGAEQAVRTIATVGSAAELAAMSVSERIEVLRLVAQIRGGEAAPAPEPVVETTPAPDPTPEPVEPVAETAPEPVKPCPAAFDPAAASDF